MVRNAYVLDQKHELKRSLASPELKIQKQVKRHLREAGIQYVSWFTWLRA
jgi:hypothetical protein